MCSSSLLPAGFDCRKGLRDAAHRNGATDVAAELTGRTVGVEVHWRATATTTTTLLGRPHFCCRSSCSARRRDDRRRASVLDGEAAPLFGSACKDEAYEEVDEADKEEEPGCYEGKVVEEVGEEVGADLCERDEKAGQN